MTRVPTILVVDDTDVVRKSAARCLRHRGYVVLEASNADQALELIALNCEQLDLVLSDLVLPSMGGVELVAEIRRRFPNVAAAYMTGHIGRSARYATALDSAVPLLVKPFTPAVLEDRVREALMRAGFGGAQRVRRSLRSTMEGKHGPTLNTATARARLLVVDDDPLMRKLLGRVLSSKGYDTSMAEDGQQAKELLARARFDLILTDVHMPRMDGIGVLRAVRDLDPDFPVILFTASPSADTAIGALQLRATAYLTKPIDPARLIDEVEKALKMHELARVRKEAHQVVNAAAQEQAERVAAAGQFDRALAGLFMLYQPIVSWSRKSVFGYEALVRSKEPSLPHPGALFESAERLDRWNDLGRMIRKRVVEPLSASGAARIAVREPARARAPRRYRCSIGDRVWPKPLRE